MFLSNEYGKNYSDLIGYIIPHISKYHDYQSILLKLFKLKFLETKHLFSRIDVWFLIQHRNKNGF